MNILDLKRQLMAMQGHHNEDGDGGAGGSMGYGNESQYGGGPGSGNGGSDHNVDFSDYFSQSPSIASQYPNIAKALSWAAGLLGVSLAGPVGAATAKSVAEKAMSMPGLSPMERDQISTASGGPNGDYAHGAATSSGAGGGAAPAASTSAASTPVDYLTAMFNGSGFNDYQTKTLPGLQAQADLATQRGNAGYTTGIDQANKSLGMADQMNQDYTNIYRPYGQKMANEVDRLGSDEYRAQQRNLAVSDVQQQADSQLSQTQRNLQRMGVNPSSGRMLAMGNQNAIATAAAKAGVAQKSDALSQQNYLSGLGAINTFGQGVQKQGLANSDSAQSWGKYAQASGVTGLSAGMDLSRNGASVASTYGTLANNRLSGQTSAQQVANQQNQYNNSNDLGNAFTSSLAGAAGKGLVSWLTGPSTSSSDDTPWYMK